MGEIKGDTRSLDYSSYNTAMKLPGCLHVMEEWILTVARI